MDANLSRPKTPTERSVVKDPFTAVSMGTSGATKFSLLKKGLQKNHRGETQI